MFEPPHGTGPELEANVSTGLLKARVSFRTRGATVGTITIPFRDYWWKRRLNLLSTQVGQQLETSKGFRDLVQSLVEHLRSRETPVAITGDALADLLPWEAFDSSFKLTTTADRYTPVRLSGTPAATGNPLRFPDGMRLVCLIGHEGPERAFDRVVVEQELRRTLDGLDVESRHRLESVVILDFTQGDLLARLRQAGVRDPHVVLYFGHGRARGAGQIRVGPQPGDWLPIEQLVAEIRGAFAMPPFWIFIACSIGEPHRDANLLHGPPAFTALSGEGAVALLAMRSQIRMTLAPIIIRSVIERLAAGASLEAAAATARRAARSADPRLWDWAAPAVWSTAYGGMRTVWRGDEDPQSGSDWWIGLRLLRQSSGDPTLGLQDTPSWARTQAEFWLTRERIRLMLPRAASPESKQAITEIAAVLAAVRRLSGVTALFIVPTGTGDFPRRLAQWANSLLAPLPLSETGGPLTVALRRLADHDLEGLNQLLHLPELFVVFLESPGDAPADRAVWHQIASAAPTTRIVVCESGNEDNEETRSWSVTRLGAEMSPPSVERVLALYPNTMALLVVLTRPVHPAVLALATGEPQLEDDSALWVPAGASGVVLTDDVRERLRHLLGPERLQAAHEAYLVARFERGVNFALEDPLTDLTHLAGAGRRQELARSVNELAEFNEAVWSEAEWIRLADILDTLAPVLRDIDREVALFLASLFVRRQELRRAAGWLELMGLTSNAVQEARRALMLSEVWKAQPGSDSKSRMWAEARRAVELSSSVPAASQEGMRAAEVLREAQMQMARLELYFHHDAPAARVILERVIAEAEEAAQAQSNTAATRTLIAAQRNLAECLFEFAPFAGNLQFQQIAQETLARALERARARGELQLGAEVAYSLAKLAETQGDFRGALRQLDTCSALALESKYYLVLRLSDLRQFWIGVRRLELPFEWLGFRSRQEPVDYLGWHGWALRFGTQSRLWAATRLASSGRTPQAIQLLQDNLATLGERYDPDSTSDRMNLARTYAGLAVLQPDSPSWPTFLRLPWARAWLEEISPAPAPIPTPQSLWGGVS